MAKLVRGADADAGSAKFQLCLKNDPKSIAALCHDLAAPFYGQMDDSG
jgi:hypothetical protein